MPKAPDYYDGVGTFLVRRPLLPVEHYPLIGDDTPVAPLGSTASLANALARTALAVGSGSLFDAVFAVDPSAGSPKRVQQKVLQYSIRMTTRCTPFGVFAATGVAEWAETTDIFDTGQISTHSRIDAGWLYNLLLELERREDVRPHLKLMVNPLLIRRGDRYFVPERPRPKSTPRDEIGGSVRASAAANWIVDVAQTPIEWIKLEEQATISLSAIGATVPKVSALISSLLEAGVLITDLFPPLSSGDPAATTLDRLETTCSVPEVVSAVRHIIAELNSWDHLPWDQRPLEYRSLVKQASAISGKPELPAFQVDTAMHLARCRVASSVCVEICRAAGTLLRLSPRQNGPPYLNEYRQRFETRFGTGELVPILDVIDEDRGIGEPRWDNWIDPTFAEGARRDSVLLTEVAETVRQGGNVSLELTDKLLAQLTPNWPGEAQLPDSLDVFAMVAAKSTKDIDAGQFNIVIAPNIGVSGGGKAVGRFAGTVGSAATALLKATNDARTALSPNAIHAEIVYLPDEARLANLMIRPQICDYEIAVGATLGSQPDRTLLLTDLLVGVRGGRFFLRSSSLGKDVVIASHHVVRSSAAPIAARVLLELGEDRVVQLSGFDWGAAGSLPYLPRVCRARAVLSPAMWRVPTEVFKSKKESTRSTEMETWPRWRDRWWVPRHVYLVDGDNRLLLDLNNVEHLDILRTEASRIKEPPSRSVLLLQEVYPSLDDCWLKGPSGRFMAELVVPLVRRVKTSPIKTGIDESICMTHSPLSPISLDDRRGLPGGKWVYLKLYTDSWTENQVLAEAVTSFLLSVQKSHPTVAGFFVRYTDPARHIRLRFAGPANYMWHELFQEVCSWASNLVEGGLSQRFSFDTYDREVDRYGGVEGMAVAERVFCADSAIVLAILSDLRREKAEPNTITAVQTLDTLLGAMGLDLRERFDWCRSQFGETRQVSERFRSCRQELHVIQANIAKVGQTQTPRTNVGSYSELMAGGQSFRKLAASGALSVTLNDLYGSIIHMHCNRLLGINAAAEREAVLLWTRVLEGLAARGFSAGVE